MGVHVLVIYALLVGLGVQLDLEERQSFGRYLFRVLTLVPVFELGHLIFLVATDRTPRE